MAFLVRGGLVGWMALKGGRDLRWLGQPSCGTDRAGVGKGGSGMADCHCYSGMQSLWRTQ